MVNPEYLKGHYAQLNDEELFRLSKTDLVPEARTVLERELGSRRQPPTPVATAEIGGSEPASPRERRVAIRHMAYAGCSLVVLFLVYAVANKSLGSGIGAAIGGAFGAGFAMFFLRLSTKIVAKYLPPLSTAYAATLVGGVACYLVGLLFAYVAAQAGRELAGTGYLLVLGINLFVYASILDLLLKSPKSTPIGFWKACLVAAIQFVTVLAVIGGTYYVAQRITA